MRCVCADCHSALRLRDGAACCVGCGKSFPIRQGVVTFTPQSDFYEGKFADTWGAGNRAWWWIKKRIVSRWRFLLQWLPEGDSLILDLGCGGGNALLTEKGGVVIGVDLSVSSLVRASSICDEVYCATAKRLPFPNGMFDAVVSLDLLGHIPIPEKDGVIQEVWRVLKPGGIAIHCIETVGRNPIQRFAQQYPDLYRRYFMDADGHYGLEPPETAVERFRRQGFQPVCEQGDDVGAVRTLREHLKRFDNEYQTKSVLMSWWVTLYRILGSSGASRYPTEGILALVSAILRRRLDLRSADSLFVCYRKI